MISNSRNRADILRQNIAGQVQPAGSNGSNRLDAGGAIGASSAGGASLTFIDPSGNNRKWWKPTRHGWFDPNAIVP